MARNFPGFAGVLLVLWALRAGRAHDAGSGANSTTDLPVAPEAGHLYEYSVTFTDGSGPIPVSNFVVDHTKLLHVVIIGEDLSSFLHVHSEDFGFSPDDQATAFPLQTTFPFAGNYLTGYDAETKEDSISIHDTREVIGTPLMQTVIVDYSSSRTVQSFTKEDDLGPLPWVSLNKLMGPADSSSDLPPFSLLTGNTYNVNITRPDVLTSMRPFNFTLSIYDASSQSPVLDMTPLWGVQAHIAVVGDDLSYYKHAHAMGNASGMVMPDMHDGMVHNLSLFGPDINGQLELPEGNFRLIFQMARGLEFIFVPFDVSVGEAINKSSSPESSSASGMAATLRIVTMSTALLCVWASLSFC